MSELRGLFITFEGVEGCGKTTQAELLEQHLKSIGHEVIRTREPGGLGVPIAEKIREILLDVEHEEMHPLTELFLYLASRTQHVADLVKPSLEKGFIVISDRFFDASIAYQGAGRGLDINMIEKFSLVATDGLVPDITFLLDISASEGLARYKKDGTELDRIEKEELEFHRRVRDGYLAAANRSSDRFRILDGGQPVNVLARNIAEIVDKSLNKLFRKDIDSENTK